MILFALKVTTKAKAGNEEAVSSVVLTNASGLLVFNSPEEAAKFGKTLYGEDNPHVTCTPIIFGYDVEVK